MLPVVLFLLAAPDLALPAPAPEPTLAASADAGTALEADPGEPRGEAAARPEAPGAELEPADAGLASAPAAAPDAGLAAADEAPGDEDPELEAMRALEEVSLDPQAQTAASLRSTLLQLGYGTLTRDRLENALEAAELSGEELAFDLAPVTDVATFDVSKVRDRYDIPVEMQPLVAQYIHFFQHGGRKWFRRWMSRSHRYIPLMQPILEAHGLPRDTVYLAMIESGFNTQAKSWAKAVGPWQFIAGTANMFDLKEDFWIDERRDPIKATHAAARFLSLLYSKLGHWYLAWAGYNTGGVRVRRLIEAHGTNDFWQLSEKKGLARETKHYVPKLIACALVAKHPEAFGFSPDEFEPEGPFEFDEVQLTDAVDLEVVAQAAGATVEELQDLNPELKRWCSPPATPEKPYTLRLPKGRRELFAENFAKVAPSERLNFKIHKVAKGDTLSKIAAQYHSAQEAILHLNHLTSARSLKLGTELLVPLPSAQALKAGKADTTLERQVARARRSGVTASRPEEQVPAGAEPTAPTGKVALAGSLSVSTVDGKKRVTYGVGRGDSLWSIARRFDVHVADLKEWNPTLGSPRGLKVGAALTVWPGPAADLSGAGAAPVAVAAKAPPSSPKASPGAGGGSKPPSGVAAGTKHTVARGETLWKLSQRYGCTVDDLKRWNGLASNDLKLGQSLIVAQ
jgi:membrane-bound lytic murein transglycosylase D